MTTYADLTAKAGEALTTAADHVTSSQDSNLLAVERGQRAQAATWSLAAAQVAATLATAEAVRELTAAIKHLEGSLPA